MVSQGIVTKVAHCRAIRNNFLKCVERFFIFLNIVLSFLGVIWVYSGVSFCQHTLWGEAQYALKDLKTWIMIWVGFNIFIIPVTVWTGILIVRKRNTKAKYLAVWATLLFFLLMLPMFTESSAYLAFQGLTIDEIKDMCALTKDEMEGKHGRMVNALYDNAKRFDDWSEQILDQYMCDEYSCPCLEYDTANGNSKKQYLDDIKKVESHGRSFKEGSKDMMYFVKPDSEELGFKTMYECLNHRLNEAEKAGNDRGAKKVESDEIARNVSQVLLKDAKLIARKIKRGTQRFEENILYQQMAHIKYYLTLEDAYNCSGMCKSSLFYFSKGLDIGPPEETCLVHLKKNLSQQSQTFAITSLATALVSLLLIIFHFTLYSRPFVEKAAQNSNDAAHQQVAQNTERAEAVEIQDIRFSIE